MLRVLVACEESQEVCKAFRSLGHEAFSCDLQDCSGGHPEWHIKDDVINVLNGGGWDIVIAHPPCTYLTVTGNRWFDIGRYGDKAVRRIHERELAADFFMKFVNCDCKHVAIENPVGCMGSRYRRADQVIQPWQFGHNTCKKTCLWLKNIPKLIPTNIVEPVRYSYIAKNGKIKHDCRERSMCKQSERSKFRSKTFHGIAMAMATQWGSYVMNELAK